MKAWVVKRPIIANYPHEKNVFDSILLYQQLVEAEKAHNIANKDLLGGISLVFKHYTLEKLKQGVSAFALYLLSEEVELFLEINLVQEKLTEGFLKLRW